MGASDSQKDQGNLLAAKQSPVFPETGGLIAQALIKRGERMMLDYAKAGVGVKVDVDGVWMNIEPRDRQTGDGMLMVLKKLATLNVKDRRSRQDGSFGARSSKVLSTFALLPAKAPKLANGCKSSSFPRSRSSRPSKSSACARRCATHSNR